MIYVRVPSRHSKSLMSVVPNSQFFSLADIKSWYDVPCIVKLCPFGTRNFCFLPYEMYGEKKKVLSLREYQSKTKSKIKLKRAN